MTAWTDKPPYRLIRSSRKTISLEIAQGELLVRAPQRMRKEDIESFVESHRRWIEKRMKLLKAGVSPLDAAALAKLKQQAKVYFPQRVAFYARKMGVSYGKISIRCQKTRWGSCSAKGNLNFNCLLLLAPPEVIDSVVVHELCHRKYMNHSKDFYRELLKAYPDYARCHAWLKENSVSLMAALGQQNSD